MKKVATARQYARRIFPLATTSIEDVLSFFDRVAEGLKTSKDFRLFLRHPSIPAEEKEAMLLKLYPNKIPDFILEWVKRLVEKDEVSLVDEIFLELKRKYDDNRNIQEVKVESVFPLEEAEKQKITEKMDRYIGKKTTIKCSINPELISGVVIRVNDEMIDNSIKSEFRELSDRLLTVSQT